MSYVKRKINKKNCIFKVDTSSDVTLIREGLDWFLFIRDKFNWN